MEAQTETPSTLISPPTPSQLKPAAAGDSPTNHSNSDTRQSHSRMASETHRSRSVSPSGLGGSTLPPAKDAKPGLSRQNTWNAGRNRQPTRMESAINWDEFNVKPISSDTAPSSRVGEVTRLHEVMAKNKELEETLERMKSKAKARIDTLSTDLADRTTLVSQLRTEAQSVTNALAQVKKERDTAQAELARFRSQTISSSPSVHGDRVAQLEADNARLAAMVAEKTASSLRASELTRQVETLEAERNSLRARVLAVESDRVEQVTRSRSRKGSTVATTGGGSFDSPATPSAPSQSARELEHLIRTLESKVRDQEFAISELRSSGLTSAEVVDLRERLAVAEVAARGAVREMLDLRKEIEGGVPRSATLHLSTAAPVSPKQAMLPSPASGTSAGNNASSPSVPVSESQLAKLALELDRVEHERKRLIGALEVAQRQADEAVRERQRLEQQSHELQKRVEQAEIRARDAGKNVAEVREQQERQEDDDASVQESQTGEAPNRGGEKLYEELSRVECQLAQSEVRVEELTAENITFVQAVEDTKLRLTELEMSYRRVVEDLLEARQALDGAADVDKERHGGYSDNEIATLLTALKSAQSDTVRLTAELATQSQQVNDLSVMLRDREQKLAETEKELAAEVSQKETLMKEKDSLQVVENQLVHLRGKTATLESQLTESRATVSKLHNQLDAILASEAAQKNTSETFKTRVLDLEAQLAARNGEVANLQQALSAANDRGLPELPRAESNGKLVAPFHSKVPSTALGDTATVSTSPTPPAIGKTGSKSELAGSTASLDQKDTKKASFNPLKLLRGASLKKLGSSSKSKESLDSLGGVRGRLAEVSRESGSNATGTSEDHPVSNNGQQITVVAPLTSSKSKSGTSLDRKDTASAERLNSALISREALAKEVVSVDGSHHASQVPFTSIQVQDASFDSEKPHSETGSSQENLRVPAEALNVLRNKSIDENSMRAESGGATNINSQDNLTSDQSESQELNDQELEDVPTISVTLKPIVLDAAPPEEGNQPVKELLQANPLAENAAADVDGTQVYPPKKKSVTMLDPKEEAIMKRNQSLGRSRPAGADASDDSANPSAIPIFGAPSATVSIPVFAFTGFSDPNNWSPQLKVRLGDIVRELGGVVNQGAEDFDPTVTHIVAPPSSKTLKTFAGLLSGKWIVQDYNWILKSGEEPFNGKLFFLTAAFENEAQSSWLHYARTLIKVGNGMEVSNPGQADIVLRGSKEKSVYPCLTVDWLNFVGMIPHPGVKVQAQAAPNVARSQSTKSATGAPVTPASSSGVVVKSRTVGSSKSPSQSSQPAKRSNLKK
ncbi:hypothetical protein M427DRAFT_70254 [Gonapodya prolifera JEL478]|uniref:BRCT domain-containing protein n=1 Tax=Gonapodya prolifera (strain JEL478) TaxID=1344416 RepID=A0A139AE15_GONPJ|nr:hypothetical protein M427DRAFT_70254 [Gonapodya prolifera JEL478]|eukprot:KXS14909.1 hypothetical protein M427DRAFT_70254 [Gonapodya prolifera JEL478]